MGTSRCSDKFERDAVHQITLRRYAVREVSERLGVSMHSRYNWTKLSGDPKPKTPGVHHEAENRRLKRELAPVTEEDDILNKGEAWIATGSRAMMAAYLAQNAK
ncbi:MAG: transposase [Rhodobacteraceae bacterium]|nr:transposase [Paracoccaceae bacterium]